MGPELTAMLPMLGLAGGGTMLQMMAQQDQADEKRNILNRQLERDNQAQDKATALVQAEGEKFNPVARQQALQTQENQVFDQTQKDMAGGANIVDTTADAGNVSDDFLRTKAQRAIDEGTRLTSIAREAAKTRAPAMVQGNDALSRAGLAGTLQNLWGGVRNMAGANQADADSVQAPGYGALGSIASSIGMAGAAGQLGRMGAIGGRLPAFGVSNVGNGINWNVG